MASYDLALKTRSSEYPINALFLKRWSPRAMTGERVSDEKLMTLFEAARWAPSTGNEQENYFLYSVQNDQHWELFFSLLDPGNQVWCKRASHLIVAISREVFKRNGKFNPVNEFDNGLATQNLLLQAAEMDIVAHPMLGFNAERAKLELKIPENYKPNAMIAVGVYGGFELLSPEHQEREKASVRKPLSELARPGIFSFE